jgi:hypothetical protein
MAPRGAEQKNGAEECITCPPTSALPASRVALNRGDLTEISIVVVETVTGAVVTISATGNERPSVTVFDTENWRFPSLDLQFASAEMLV